MLVVGNARLLAGQVWGIAAWLAPESVPFAPEYAKAGSGDVDAEGPVLFNSTPGKLLQDRAHRGHLLHVSLSGIINLWSAQSGDRRRVFDEPHSIGCA